MNARTERTLSTEQPGCQEHNSMRHHLVLSTPAFSFFFYQVINSLQANCLHSNIFLVLRIFPASIPGWSRTSAQYLIAFAAQHEVLRFLTPFLNFSQQKFLLSYWHFFKLWSKTDKKQLKKLTNKFCISVSWISILRPIKVWVLRFLKKVKFIVPVNLWLVET